MRGSWACDLLHMFAIFVGTGGARGAVGAAVSPVQPPAVSAD
ncbi:hypothetical protein SLI_4844 [Streptomyces lividans 1326]|uniref:Uncharacterized protein n=1 Tax=Streptomyces lividans 1326 TaxID=1200984 RepID=A0A7U9DX81_STRLI|nr:hypothetical protein SLI_4844 [Streptomyces lividans 1326]